MIAIWKRELQAYFYTPVGYVFMGIFLLVSGLMFYANNLTYLSGTLSGLFGSMSFLFMFLVPILTMRLLSEEKRSKTDQLLLTSPVSIGSIVLGKFLAAVTVMLATLAFTLVYVVVIAVYSQPMVGEIFTNYLGFALLCSAYIAIGVLMSAISESQVAAAVATLGVNFVLMLLESILPSMNVPVLTFLPSAFGWLSLQQRHYNFTYGFLSIADIVYFVSFCAVVLFFTVRVIDKRRWSEG